ncbi:universal stress protein [Nocardioides guangzhouensis]|uniref:Universal stress protein n=1 Tax=Nocardioides guangzhouensis TaxID=2497878 RepID=A0A4Q4ZKJ5_9ACTN|nr:universal stress protein [Nocardioides guangzhouensis]RYP88873.1 universal stress protein [Nocardioides guangzhouensis]
MSGIVVAWAPNEYGAAALEAGLVEARRRGTSVVLVNGTRGDRLVDDRFASDGQIGSLERQLVEAGVEHEVRQTMGEDIADQVLSVAEEIGAELVVIGLRRRSPVGKLIMGSTSQRVLLGAHCPVLAVKP